MSDLNSLCIRAATIHGVRRFPILLISQLSAKTSWIIQGPHTVSIRRALVEPAARNHRCPHVCPWPPPSVPRKPYTRGKITTNQQFTKNNLQ